MKKFVAKVEITNTPYKSMKFFKDDQFDHKLVKE